ncbi:MAG: peptidylprolyl isomerase [Bacteroidales bacterium]|nr:peptidylprolyl isomerase [Bacteroidales bacterium]
MIAEKNSVVSIVYELRAGSKEGEVVESLNNDNPLTFLFGTGGLLPKFEEQLNGLKTGDSFEFLLNSEDAYGPVVENAIVHVPQSVFEIDGQIDENLIKIGSMVPMMDAEGRRLNGKVIAIEGDAVRMDFNHPMAGNDLFFKGEVTDIRSATEEELSHGHIHAGGACGCGGNGESSCEDGNCEDKGSCSDDGGHGCGC